jgi:DNA polymerase-3 subunit delta'
VTALAPHTWHAGQWTLLSDAHSQGRLPHALLLAGPEGVGKRRFAQALTNYLLCLQPTAAGACGECRSCRLVAAQTHPDRVWIAPEENSRAVKIDQIRALTDFVAKTSQMGGKKIAVIEPAESMNTNAANALLKNLEEPAGDTHLVLVSDAPGRLLPTIRSRCLQTVFGVPAASDSLSWLVSITGSNVSAERLLRLAGGRPIAALAMHEGDTLTLRDGLREIWLALWQQRDCFSAATRWMEYEHVDVLYWAAVWLQDAIRSKAGADADSISDVESAQHFAKAAQNWVSWNDAAGLLAKLDQVNEIRRQLATGANPNKQLLLENLAANLVSKHRLQI